MTPQPAAVWTTSSAPAASSGRNCSSPVRFSPAATDARIPRPTATIPSASQRRTGSSTQIRSTVRSSSATCRTACLRVQDSLASSIRPGRDAGCASARTSRTMAEPGQVLVDVEAALQLRRPQAALGVSLVGRGELLVGQGDVQTRGVRRHSAVPTAEQPPQRLTGRLRLDVPQRRVERTDGPEGVRRRGRS